LAIIMQQNLFSWQEVEELGDLERLKLVIETMPDRELIQALEKRRKGKRDDYPIIAMWNSVLAGAGTPWVISASEHRIIKEGVAEERAAAKDMWI